MSAHFRFIEHLVLCATLSCAACSIPDCHADENKTAWAWAKMTHVVKNDRESRGFVIYTTGEDSPGAAFRCVEGKLYAFFSTEPANMREMIAITSRQRRDWTVWVSIGEGERREEKWINLHGGRLYLVRSRSTALKLFRAAESGGQVEFKRKYREVVKFLAPADDDGVFDRFKDHCGF